MRSLGEVKGWFAVSLAVGVLAFNPWGALSFAVDKPDLVVTSVTDPPASAVPGDSFTVTAIVANQGTLASPATATKFYLVGAVRKNLSGIQDVAPLAPSASDGPTVTVALFSDTLPGTYVLQACADADDVVAVESDNTNNCTNSAGSIEVLQTPDLLVTSITDPPSSAPQGGSFAVTNTVKNVGPVSANPSTTKYYLVANPGPGKKDLQGIQNVPTLGAGLTFTEQETVTVRTDTVPGQYFLQACADAGKADAEQDENNNCLTSTGSIQVTARADLVVTSVAVQGAPLTVNRSGGTLTITAAVANQGLADAPSSTMKYLLVKPSGATKNLKGTHVVGSLVSGGTTTVEQAVTFYSDTALGTYTVQACADSAKVVPETSEGNNCATTTETVTVEGSAPANVDLVVTAVTTPPASALPGESFSLTATVKNLGADTTVASNTRFFLAGSVRKNLKGFQPIGPLGPGASDGPQATIQVYSDTIPGTYTVQACADGDATNAELVETNNCADAGTLTVLEAPDLVVTSITNPPSTGEQGGSFTVQNTVKNIGPVATTQSTLTKYYLVSATSNTKKDLSGTQTVPVLGSNQTFTEQETVTIRADTALGRYHLQACADSGKVASEGDENNNCATSSGTILVAARPDLVVTSVAVEGDPTTVARQGSLTITAVVKNQGLADITKSSTIKFVLFNIVGGGTKNLKGTQPIPQPLAAGDSINIQGTVTVYGDTPLGDYQVRACADSGKVIAESDEKNNCGTAPGTLTVTAN